MDVSEAYLGDMLVALGALTSSDLSEARQISRTLKQPVLKVLVQSGFMMEQELNDAVEAVRQVEPGRLAEDIAKAAYNRARQKGITFAQALKEVTFIPEDLTPISQPVFFNQLPNNNPSNNDPPQIQRVPLPKQQPWTGHMIKLETTDTTIASLMADSGIVSCEIGETAAKAALEKRMPVEEILLKSGQISEAAYKTVAQLRELLEAKTIQPLVAQEILRKVVSRNITVERALAEMGLMRCDGSVHIRLGEILMLAGFVQETDLEEALKLATWNDTLLGKMLTVCGYVSSEVVINALQCQFLIREGLIKVEQAVIALHYCERCRTTIDDAIAETQKCA